MMTQRAQQIPAVQFRRGLVSINPWSAAQGQQGIVGNSAQRRAQDCGQRQLVRRVVEKPQQLNQVGYLFALIETLCPELSDKECPRVAERFRKSRLR